jgi:uncharacterized membrane protein
MSIAFFIIGIILIIVGVVCASVRVDKYVAHAFVLGIIAVIAAFSLAAIEDEQAKKAQSEYQREQMHQCLKDGGQWVQYSRSGFECVRAYDEI